MRKYRYDVRLSLYITEDQQAALDCAVRHDTASNTISDYVRKWLNTLPGQVQSAPTAPPPGFNTLPGQVQSAPTAPPVDANYNPFAAPFKPGTVG